MIDIMPEPGGGVDFTYDRLSDFPHSLQTYLEIFPEAFTHYRIVSDTIRTILDGACGYGASSKALGLYFKRSKIWAVSKYQFPIKQVREELSDRLIIEDAFLIDFLKRDMMFNLIFLGNASDTRINSEQSCELLAHVVNKNGFVFTSVYPLEPNLMKRHFDQLPPHPTLEGYFNGWVKK